MKSNLQYWKARAKARVEDYTADADKISAELGKAYYAAERMLKEESRKVFKGFQNAFKLSKSEAKRLVGNTNVALPSKTVKSIIDSLSDNDLKNQLLAYLSAPAYQYRMKRLDNLAKSADKVCKQLYTTELRTDTVYFATEIDKAYKHLIFDIQQGTGAYGAFNQIPQSRIQEILKHDWSGEHYSKRIWGNTQDLAETLKQNMIESFLTGESEREAAARIQQRFKVGFNEARRLIRTDNTFITNQAELEGYNEAEIEEYTYMAVMDNDTSDECRELNGKSFKVKDAKPGVNLPPMHPWCRSTTIGKLPSEEELDAMWDKDMAEYVPEGLTFDEWLDGLQPTEDGKLVYTGRNADNSDIGGSIKRTFKSAIKGEKVVSYDELPETIRNNFEAGLKNSTTEARLAIKHELDTLDVCVNDNSKARFFSDVDLVQIRSDDTADTLAHEIFHRIDKKHKVNKKNDLLSPLKNDWDALQIKAQGDVVTYLVSEYPTAFTVKNSGKVVLRKEYRGISDIISGLSNNGIKLGYRHNNDYWAKKDALKKEAWAQFGRIMYSNNPDVLKMFENLFTSFNESAIIALKDVI